MGSLPHWDNQTGEVTIQPIMHVTVASIEHDLYQIDATVRLTMNGESLQLSTVVDSDTLYKLQQNPVMDQAAKDLKKMYTNHATHLKYTIEMFLSLLAHRKDSDPSVTEGLKSELKRYMDELQLHCYFEIDESTQTVICNTWPDGSVVLKEDESEPPY